MDEVNKKNIVISNPKEITAVVRNQTFIIENELSAAKVEEGEFPLGIFSSFSRFPVCIINDSGKAATANINLVDMLEMIAKSKVLHKKVINDTFSSESHSSEEKKACYTVQITSGKLKGRTPADVLINEPNGIDLLRQQYKWLNENIKKYPKNKIQMDAIQEAVELSKENGLDAASVTVAQTYKLLDTSMRPLIRRPKKDDPDKFFVYEIRISYIGGDYPVSVEISNYYAPVIKREDGTLNVLAKQAVDRVNNVMNLTMSEWMNQIIHLVEANIKGFEMAVYPSQQKIANDIARKNRIAAKES